VIWPITVFKLIMTKWYFKNQLWRHFSDVIVITSSKNVTKLKSQGFSILGLSQSKFLATQVAGKKAPRLQNIYILTINFTMKYITQQAIQLNQQRLLS